MNSSSVDRLGFLHPWSVEEIMSLSSRVDFIISCFPWPTHSAYQQFLSLAGRLTLFYCLGPILTFLNMIINPNTVFLTEPLKRWLVIFELWIDIFFCSCRCTIAGPCLLFYSQKAASCSDTQRLSAHLSGQHGKFSFFPPSVEFKISQLQRVVC